MDIGATICTPKSVSCHQCPIKNYCVAHAEVYICILYIIVLI